MRTVPIQPLFNALYPSQSGSLELSNPGRSQNDGVIRTRKSFRDILTVFIQYTSVTDRYRGVYPPAAMTQTSPSPSPFPLHSLPSLPSTGTGAEPPVAGVRGYPRKKMEIEIGFGAFWRIFVSKRQLSSVSLFVNKN